MRLFYKYENKTATLSDCYLYPARAKTILITFDEEIKEEFHHDEGKKIIFITEQCGRVRIKSLRAYYDSFRKTGGEN